MQQYTIGGNPTGTCLQGYIKAKYETLVSIFGEPETTDGYKSEAEWCITTERGVATIYDYKVGKCYLGEDEGLTKEEITEWHVGGSNEEVVYIVERIIEEQLAKDSEALYTLETLKAINQSYDHEHYINDSDVSFANAYKLLIEVSRSKFAPKAGDILLVNGKYQHIDATENDYLKTGKLTICESAMVPFLRVKANDSKATFSLSTSGGAWYGLDAEQIEFSGEQKYKTFCFFGHGGARANGAVELRAKVNVWVKK